MRYITLDGKRHAWRDLLKLRRDQKKAARQHQLTLFPLKEDVRPKTECTASGRYEEPSLLALLK